MKIKSLDHLVLTVQSLEKTISFYEQALGMQVETFGEGRIALRFGNQKINLHEVGNEFEPKAMTPTSGSADLCFISDTPMVDVMAHLKKLGIAMIGGPVQRTGAVFSLLSIYIRDPDGNLIEIANENIPSLS